MGLNFFRASPISAVKGSIIKPSWRAGTDVEVGGMASSTPPRLPKLYVPFLVPRIVSAEGITGHAVSVHRGRRRKGQSRAGTGPPGSE